MPNVNPPSAEAAPAVISLPQERGAFIGREDEIERLVTLLDSPECRLVTLLGPGGAGKTRLAVETARTFGLRRAVDVYFVPLQPVDAVERIASAVCDALSLRGGQDEPRDRLLNFLAGKDLLLVLDNFEHLVAGVDLVSELIQRAPLVKLLATSRESMRLGEEWRFEVEGLPSPVKGSRSEAMSFAAVRLFAERARRVRPDFDPSDSETADVVRICSLVQGSPLAIEIAASWIRSLTASDIAVEIERNIDFLSTQMRDVPPRHRSMQAVFQQSWDSLSAEEQDVFKRLSVFRGGFSREAAAEVAGASIDALSSLLDRSLIRQADGRYQVHEVLRQFAAGKLAASPADAEEAAARHTAYYSTLLKDKSLGLFGADHLAAAEDVRRELDNLLSAFRRALDAADYEAIALSYHAIGNYFEVTSLYAEGYEVLLQAVDAVRRSPDAEERALLARILVDLGWNALRVGEIEAAASLFEESIAIHDELGLPPAPGQATEPRTGLGVVELVRGNFEAARALGHQALKTCEDAGQLTNVPYACYLLTSAYSQLGKLSEAKACAARAFEQAKANDDIWFVAYCLNELGNVAAAMGDLEAAKAHYHESFEIRREFDDPEGMALALNCLGRVALLAGDHAEAAGHFTRSLSIYRRLADKGGLAASLKGLGEAKTAENNLTDAAAYFREALDTTLPMGFTPMTLSILVGVSDLLIRGGKLPAARDVLNWLRSQASWDEDSRNRARKLVQEIGLKKDESAEPLASRSIAEIVAAAESALIGLSDSYSAAAMHEALVEPLSDREKEVLGYVARGMTNREIAEILIVSVGTIKAHTHNIYEKLDAMNRVQALARARELGIIPS